MFEMLLAFFTNLMIIVGGTVTLIGLLFLAVLFAVEVYDFFKEKGDDAPFPYDGEDIWQAKR